MKITNGFRIYRSELGLRCDQIADGDILPVKVDDYIRSLPLGYYDEEMNLLLGDNETFG